MYCRTLRRTNQETEVNIAYRWFLGYGLNESVPHFSTMYRKIPALLNAKQGFSTV